MPASLLLPAESLLSPQSVQLGRLVRNAKHPHQDYLYPFPPTDKPTIITKKHQNFQEIISNARGSSSSLWSRLLKFPAIASIATTATESRTYILDNSTEWFNRACKTPTTREWMRDAIKHGTKLYLTVGYHVIIDALVHERSGELSNLSEIQFGNDSNSTLGIKDPGRMTLTAQISSQDTHERRFGAEGEHVYAVQYRKVRVKWFSSKNIDNATLEEGNRWKIALGVRGDDEDVDGEDDVIEPYLGEMSGGDRVLSEDGQEEFIVDWNSNDDDDDDDDDE